MITKQEVDKAARNSSLIRERNILPYYESINEENIGES